MSENITVSGRIIADFVNCGNCIYATIEEAIYVGESEPRLAWSCLKHEIYVEEDDYCSWGERKTAD